MTVTRLTPEQPPDAKAARPQSARRAMLALAGLATVVTETLSANGAMFKIERMRITDAGRHAIRG